MVLSHTHRGVEVFPLNVINLSPRPLQLWKGSRTWQKVNNKNDYIHDLTKENSVQLQRWRTLKQGAMKSFQVKHEGLLTILAFKRWDPWKLLFQDNTNGYIMALSCMMGHTIMAFQGVCEHYCCLEVFQPPSAIIIYESHQSKLITHHRPHKPYVICL